MSSRQLTRWIYALRREVVWQTHAAFPGLANLTALDNPPGRLVSQDAISRVNYVEEPAGAYYLKHYRQPGKGWRRWLGRSRARTEWENLQRLNEWGIPVPHLLAYGESWHDGIYRGALVTAALPNICGLDRIPNDYPELWAQTLWRRAVLSLIAQNVAALHTRRFAHGDLNWRNVLVSINGPAQIYLIDCPVGSIWPLGLWALKRRRDLWMLDKLARHFLSRTQRLRWLLDYLGRARLTKADKRLVWQIIGKSTHMPFV